MLDIWQGSEFNDTCAINKRNIRPHLLRYFKMALKKLDEIHFVILALEKKGLVNRI